MSRLTRPRPTWTPPRGAMWAAAFFLFLNITKPLAAQDANPSASPASDIVGADSTTIEVAAPGIPAALSQGAVSPALGLAEWSFLSDQAAKARTTALPAVIARIDLFILEYPQLREAADAQWLLAKLSQRAGDDASAMTALARILHEHPDSSRALEARTLFLELGREALSRKLMRDVQSLAFPKTSKGSEAKRMAGLVTALGKSPAASFFSKPALELARRFQERFPNDTGMPSIVEATAKLDEAAKRYPAAELAYREITVVFPDSGQGPNAYLGIARILSRPHSWPWRIFHGDAFHQDCAKAIGALDDLIKKYPERKDLTLTALEQEASIFSRWLGQYRSAIDTDGKIADMFPGSPKGLSALKDAADLAHGKLKDYSLEVQLRRRIVDGYPAPDAPAQLLKVAKVEKEDLGDETKALEVCEEVTDKYPGTKFARTARRMIRKLASSKGSGGGAQGAGDPKP